MRTTAALRRRNTVGHFGRLTRLFSRGEVALLVAAFSVLVAAAILDLDNDGYARWARPMLFVSGGVCALTVLFSAHRARASTSRGVRRDRELPPLPGFEREPVVLAIVGDTGHRPVISERLAAAIRTRHTESPLTAVWLLGDLIDSNDSYLDARELHIDEPFAPLIRGEIPILAALGNHDHSSGFARELVREPLLHMEGCRYYSRTFGRGIVTFFVLDSERLPDDPAQVQWLLGALEGCTSRWKVLISHHPLVSSNAGHGPDPFRRRALARALRPEAGLHLVLSGHNHLYERSRHRHGVTHLVVGTGSIATSNRIADHPETAASSVQKGVSVLMEADADRIVIRAIDLDGSIVDEFVLGMPHPRFSLPQPTEGADSR